MIRACRQTSDSQPPAVAGAAHQQQRGTVEHGHYERADPEPDRHRAAASAGIGARAGMAAPLPVGACDRGDAERNRAERSRSAAQPCPGSTSVCRTWPHALRRPASRDRAGETSRTAFTAVPPPRPRSGSISITVIGTSTSRRARSTTSCSSHVARSLWMGDDDHLVGREQPQRVLEREDRDPPRRRHPWPRSRFAASAAIEASRRRRASSISSSTSPAARSSGDFTSAGATIRARAGPPLGVPDDLAHERLIADHLVREDHDPVRPVPRSGRAVGAVGRPGGHRGLRTLGPAGETCSTSRSRPRRQPRRSQGRAVEPVDQVRDRLEHHLAPRASSSSCSENPPVRRPDGRTPRTGARPRSPTSSRPTITPGPPPAFSSPAATRSGCGFVRSTSAAVVQPSTSSRASSRSR